MAALLILTLTVASCVKNPFSTRDTEQPYGSAGTWETPQSPDITVRNLLYAYNEMIISNYQLCFSDSFFYSSPEDSIDAINNGRGELFMDWDKSVEVATAVNLFSTYSSSDSLEYFLTMAPVEQYPDFIEDTTATMYRNYTFVLISTYDQGADTLTAQGMATFQIIQEQLNWWTIQVWEDLPAVPGQTDWGDIKAEYRR